jgi:hypothetical protein
MSKARKDMVIAIYLRDCYAGETILKLEKVLFDEEIPEKYKTYEYETKLMILEEYKER